MQALSASTSLSDPYRAGIALGEQLSAIRPEVVFLFSSVDYGPGTELLDGLYDALETDSVVIIGNSGDGVYEGVQARDLGAAALALNSNGAVRWCLGVAEGVQEDPEGAARRAIAALEAEAGPASPAFIYVSSDFRTDAGRLERVLREVDVPIVGGLAADGYAMSTCLLYANRRVLQDAVVMLGAVGPVAFDILLGQSLDLVGQPGRIDDAVGTTLRSIDGLSAMRFIERATGRPALMADRGRLNLAVSEPEHPGRKHLRSIVTDVVPCPSGQVRLFGGVEPGHIVQVCATGPDHLEREFESLVEQSRALAFKPVAGLIVSCAWRKNVLADRPDLEVRSVAEGALGGLPLAGYPSLGEIAPLKEDGCFTDSKFHNNTCVVLVIGEAR